MKGYIQNVSWKPEWKRPPRPRWKGDIKAELKEIGRE
jgi:hypothetical protein